jgi:hypothetical protein
MSLVTSNVDNKSALAYDTNVLITTVKSYIVQWTQWLHYKQKCLATTNTYSTNAPAYYIYLIITTIKRFIVQWLQWLNYKQILH